jgi:outer membrane lipoprotein-sorting protein
MNARIPVSLLPALLLAAIAVALLGPATTASAEEAPSAEQILRRADQVMGAPRDQDTLVTLVLLDKDGNRKERTLRVYQKGADTRMARFLTPADQKGISVLSLPDGSIYLYLPAYQKVKRIASSVKNTAFAGTDFTYEDMEARRYADSYTAELLKTETDCWVLQLTPKPGASGGWARLLMWVRRDNGVPVIVEYYDAKGRLERRLTSERLEQIGGYWVAREREMHDIAKNHRSRMIVDKAAFDSGLSEEIFTTRYLER